MRTLRLAGSFLLLAAAGLIGDPGAEAAGARSADDMHWDAWDAALADAPDDPAVRFAFYAYRTLAVAHPEIYLQADQLFSEIVENLPGGWASYVRPDLRDFDFFRRIDRGEIEGRPFSWRDWRVIPDSILDAEGEAKVHWLDRRCPSAAILLHAASPRLSTLEAAVLRYTQTRRLGRSEEGLFVVVDGAGRGFLIEDTLVRLGGFHSWDDGLSGIAPVLVFNERSVYYPLFGRDDRDGSPSLRRLLAELGPPATLDLSTTDLRRISRLRSSSALADTESYHLAVRVASGFHGKGNRVVNEKWSAFRGDAPALEEHCVTLALAKVYSRSNRLSLVSAAVAAQALEGELAERLERLETDYLALCGRRVAPRDSSDMRREAWGILWSYGLLALGIDDLARTRAGEGHSQAWAMAAILDLVGISYAAISVSGKRANAPDQEWLLADEGRYQYTLGTWNKVRAPGRDVRHHAIIIDGYSFSGRRVHFSSRGCCADVRGLTIAGDLTRLAALFPHRTLRFSGDSGPVSLARLSHDLVNDSLEIDQLLWPVATGGRSVETSGR